MEENTKYFEDRPFDNSIVEELDMESIRAAFEEGNKCLHYQFEIITQLRRNCSMILGWVFASIVALTGYLGVAITSAAPQPALMITAGYELLFAFAIAFILIRGVLYRRTVFCPGTSPSYFLREDILNPLKGIKDKSKYTSGWHLSEIQYKIMENDKEQMYEVLVYRKALALMAIAVISGAILFSGLWICL